MNLFKQFWLFFMGEEDQQRLADRKIAKHQAALENRSKKQAEYYHQAHLDADDLLDGIEDADDFFMDGEFTE